MTEPAAPRMIPLVLSGRDAQRVLALTHRIELARLRIAHEQRELQAAERERDAIGAAAGIPEGLAVSVVADPADAGGQVPEGTVLYTASRQPLMVPAPEPAPDVVISSADS